MIGWTVVDGGESGSNESSSQLSVVAEQWSDPPGELHWASNVLHQAGLAGRLVVPGMLKSDTESGWDPNFLIFLPILAIVLFGWLRKRVTREGGGVLAWGGLAMTVFLMVLWPHKQGVRYLLPLGPVLWLGIYQAMPRHWKPNRLLGLLLVLHLVAAMVFEIGDRRDVLPSYERWPALRALASSVDVGPCPQWVSVGLDPGDRWRLSLFFNRRVLSRPVNRIEEGLSPDGLILTRDTPTPEGWQTLGHAGPIRFARPVDHTTLSVKATQATHAK